MKLNKFLIASIIGLSATTSGSAQFFDTSSPEDFFRLGARIGFNMSNVSASSSQFTHNQNTWGSGFDGGIVAEILIRDWFGIQPGIFYQSRSNTYTHILSDASVNQPGFTNVGHTLYYSFNIPVMFEARFNVTEQLRWTLEAGPYISFGVGHNDKGIRITPSPETNFKYNYFDRHAKTQGGLKFGTGLELKNHYYVGIHYMAGIGNAWKANAVDYTGHNKAWTFTLGYNF